MCRLQLFGKVEPPNKSFLSILNWANHWCMHFSVWDALNRLLCFLLLNNNKKNVNFSRIYIFFFYDWLWFGFLVFLFISCSAHREYKNRRFLVILWIIRLPVSMSLNWNGTLFLELMEEKGIKTTVSLTIFLSYQTQVNTCQPVFNPFILFNFLLRLDAM